MSPPAAFFDLVEALAVTPQYANKRQFSLPLAALVPPDGDNDAFAIPTGLPAKDIYAFTDVYVHDNANGVTTDVSLVITIRGPFAADPSGALPPAAIRVHAMARGKLGFRPPGTLVLRTAQFSALTSAAVPWWKNWSDANCIPQDILYDDIDLTHLDAYLRNVLPDGGTQGIKLPGSKDPPSRTKFLEDFYRGDVDADGAPTTYFLVEPGAVIGRAGAAISPGDLNQLTLRVRYSDHLKPTAQPMNPRELLYLLFGKDSSVATNHPLLRALDTLPSPPPAPRNEMSLRPPLRTWARLMWEAEREEAADAKLAGAARHWSAPGDLGSGGLSRLFDTLFRRNGQRVNYAGIQAGENKCNIFTSELCVRAGFRAMAFQVNGTAEWHYIRANAHANAGALSLAANVILPPLPAGRYPIMGSAEDASRQWGWVLTHYLLGGSKTREQINDMMQVEGRALILAGARPATGLGSGRLTDHSGHIVLVRELPPYPPPLPTPPNPQLTPNTDPAAAGPGTMLRAILAITAQASGGHGGVAHEQYELVLGGSTAFASGTSGFARIQLLEASPGRDPDVLQGAFDLHIKALDRIRLSSTAPDAIP